MFRTIGHQTDALVMKGRSTFEDRGAYVIQRTPEEPDFWFGNTLIYREPRPEAEMREAFAAAHPQAGHLTLQFDMIDWSLHEGLAGGFSSDLELELCDTLVAERDLTGPNMPIGVNTREITSDADWELVIGLQHEIGLEQGYPQGTHLAYLRTKFSFIRRAVAEKRAVWLGAFEGDVLVADMGVFWDQSVARYQSVETRRSYRGRGICPALLVEAHRNVRRRAPNAKFVIVADQDAVAGQIYRRVGFSGVETLMTLSKPGH